MIRTPWKFESKFTEEDFQKVGELTLRWSLIDHYLGHCLQKVTQLTDEDAVKKFSLCLPWRNLNVLRRKEPT
jgi:hypothetical protein